MNHGLDTDEEVYFYEQDYYVLSNFSSFSIVFDGVTFPTSEHAYHYQKFAERHYHVAQEILCATSAHEAFKIAEKNANLVDAEWYNVRVSVMKNILRAKVEQHPYVKKKLLETGHRKLIENSWRDAFWGWGPNQDGQNELGKLWMVVRDEVRNNGRPMREGAPWPTDAEFSDLPLIEKQRLIRGLENDLEENKERVRCDEEEIERLYKVTYPVGENGYLKLSGGVVVYIDRDNEYLDGEDFSAEDNRSFRNIAEYAELQRKSGQRTGA